MSSEFGKHLKVSVFGESHGPGIGVVINGLPPGTPINLEVLQAFLKRRAPGQSRLTTQRKESDRPEFLSGFHAGRATGSPMAALIRNSDARSKDYANLAKIPRPSHADYTAKIKYQGFADMRGGGHFSGRLTAPLCIAGGIALQALNSRGVTLAAHLLQIGGERDRPLNPVAPDNKELLTLLEKSFPVLDEAAGIAMQKTVSEAAAAGDSVGGIVEAQAFGLSAGLGDPMFEGVENRLATALFGIPGVKGLSFGSGFDSAGMRGSVHNDPFTTADDGSVRTTSNHAGGILGGITNGMPVNLQVAMKPTPSISLRQDSVHLSDGSPASLVIEGRHDPCIAIRAVPVIEAVMALVLLDMILEEESTHETRRTARAD